MDSDHKPPPNTTNELFICFTSQSSRLSSSSMKMSSKSILSPGRVRDRDPGIALHTSLSRRLRSNGSIKGGKGGASPMFPTGGKKRGSGFDNPEPSSPKVTCIGQVRVKTKKQGKKIRALNKNKKQNEEVSFRKLGNSQNTKNTQDPDNEIGFQDYQDFQELGVGGDKNQRNQQRWVHLPLTICEAFSCLFPCRPSCFSPAERGKEEKVVGSGNGEGQSSCGAVFARWLVAMQEGEGGKERDIELVVGGNGDGDEGRNEIERPVMNSRRHVFDELEIVDGEICQVEKNEEEGRVSVSVSVPPKNALLLMRCRSDPNKMAALANRFWESPVVEDVEEHDNGNKEDEYVTKIEQEQEQEKVEDEYETKIEHEQEQEKVEDEYETKMEQEQEKVEDEYETESNLYVNEEEQSVEAEADSDLFTEFENDKEEDPEEDLDMSEVLLLLFAETELEKLNEEEVEQNMDLEWENASSESLSSTCEEERIADNGEGNPIENNEEEGKASSCSSWSSLDSDGEIEDESEMEIEKTKFGSETEILKKMSEEEQNVIHERSDPEDDLTSEFEEVKTESYGVDQEMRESSGLDQETSKSHGANQETSKSYGSNQETSESYGVDQEMRESFGANQETRESYGADQEIQERALLPDCLLMMMCEPKLSMEVSKETWVCSTDFIRRQTKKVVNPSTINGRDEKSNKNEIIDSDSNHGPKIHPTKPQQPPQQPPRSSCCLPARTNDVNGVSMGTMLEQKHVNAIEYEPFVLTRCKSAPIRAASKLEPDTCFWKNRNLEPHRRSNFALGKAGIGF